MARVNEIVFVVVIMVWLMEQRAHGQTVSFTTSGEQVQNVPITESGLYEITAAGACGGGSQNQAGGHGGEIAGLLRLEVGFKIFYIVGEIGQSRNAECATAGGGGATVVYYTGGQNIHMPQMLLVGPGGGGAGHNQKAIDPDYNENTHAISKGGCPVTNDNFFQAATGKNFIGVLDKTNFSYNPTKNNPNLTLSIGCNGGFGGGGQGGFMVDRNNFTDSGGGGGGGGGYSGGQTDVGGKFGVCTAGGPGKPYCDHIMKCSVPKKNVQCSGAFKLNKHKPYEPLPEKKRSNEETPYVPVDPQQSGLAMRSTQWLLIMSVGYLILDG